MKDLVKTVLRGVREGEKIYLFGDGDLDGVVAVLIFEEGLEKLGRECSLLFNNREKHGYGLSPHYISRFEKKEPGLLVAFDLGTNNHSGVERLKEAGFEVLIVDHHPALGSVPPVSAILNPKEKEGEEGEELCAAALSYKLVLALLEEAGRKFQKEPFLELAMLATISDHMPLEGENQTLIEEGVEALRRTERASLRALLSESRIATREINRRNVERCLVPLLSACGSKKGGSEAYTFLKTEEEGRAEEAVSLLIQKRGFQKERTREIVGEARESREADPSFLFQGGRSWPLVLCARAASRLVRELGVPVFLYHRGKEESQGSARGPGGFDLLGPLAACDHLLLNGGGHPRAAGFGFKNENGEKVKRCLGENMECGYE